MSSLSPVLITPTPYSQLKCEAERKKREIKLQGDKLADVKFRLGREEVRSSCALVGLRFHSGPSC